MPKSDGLKRAWQDPDWRAAQAAKAKDPGISQHRIACLLRSAKFRAATEAKKAKAEIDRKHLRSEIERVKRQNDDLLAALCQIYIVDRQNRFVAGKLDVTAISSAEFMLRQRVEALEKRCEELEDEVESARAGYGLADWQRHELQDIGFTRQEAALLAVVMSREHVTREMAQFALVGDKDCSDRLKDVMVCKIRRKLRRLGAEIVTVWGDGVTMPPESKAKVRAAVAALKRPLRAAAE